jgi:hypothetical protein
MYTTRRRSARRTILTCPLMTSLLSGKALAASATTSRQQPAMADGTRDGMRRTADPVSAVIASLTRRYAGTGQRP